MSAQLREGVQRLEITTRVTLGVLAVASGVYTYLGVRELLNGNATIVFFAAVIYSVAVSVGIYAFWTFLLRFLPHVRDISSRSLLFGCMGLGALMIIAMSAWLNASALAGAAAIQQHLSNSVEAYTRDLNRAHENAIAAQGLLPDIQLAAARFQKLSESEKNGSLTGTSGSGTVVQLLSQMSGQLNDLSSQVSGSNEKVQKLFDEGSKHLAKMRELVSARGPIAARSDAFGAETIALSGTINSLQQTSVAPAVKRAADNLLNGFVAPVAGGRGDLFERQTAVVGKVEDSVKQQAKALSAAADKILDAPKVEPERFQPLSPAEAVLRYAGDFVPSWAGAISIDLMPAVLVLILCVVHAGIRRENEPQAATSTMTAAELIAALQYAREVEAAGAGVPSATRKKIAQPGKSAEKAQPEKPAKKDAKPKARKPEPEPEPEPDFEPEPENVTPLSAVRAVKE
jgi:hypothetical protein